MTSFIFYLIYSQARVVQNNCANKIGLIGRHIYAVTVSSEGSYSKLCIDCLRNIGCESCLQENHAVEFATLVRHLGVNL